MNFIPLLFRKLHRKLSKVRKIQKSGKHVFDHFEEKLPERWALLLISFII